jgi:hypothetical protein
MFAFRSTLAEVRSRISALREHFHAREVAAYGEVVWSGIRC